MIPLTIIIAIQVLFNTLEDELALNKLQLLPINNETSQEAIDSIQVTATLLWLLLYFFTLSGVSMLLQSLHSIGSYSSLRWLYQVLPISFAYEIFNLCYVMLFFLATSLFIIFFIRADVEQIPAL